jgi:hypothetical protein
MVFFSPAALFDALRERPRWLDAMVVVVALGLIVQALLPADLIREAALANLPANASAEQRAAMERAMPIGNTIRWIATVIVPPILMAIVAGLVLLIWNVLRGGGARYPQALAITTHSYVIWALGGLITLPLVLATGDLRTTLALHLPFGFLDPGSWLYRFLQGINVFGLWTMIVLGVGVSRIYPRRASAGGAAVTLVAIYVALKAVGAFLQPG